VDRGRVVNAEQALEDVRVGGGEEHVDAVVVAVVVFQLGLGQGGAVFDGPVDGLELAVDDALLEHAGEDLDDGGLVLRAHGDVRVVELADDAEALELPGLDAGVAVGVLGAAPADLGAGHADQLVADLALDAVFDGQPVAVPPGDEGGVEAGHVLEADDDVLEHLVQGGAHVNVAVGVGRAVVEDEPVGAAAGDADLPVQVAVLPPLLDGGLLLQQPRPHGEVRRPRVQRVLV